MSLEDRVRALGERADEMDVTVSALSDAVVSNAELLWMEIGVLNEAIQTLRELVDLLFDTIG